MPLARCVPYSEVAATEAFAAVIGVDAPDGVFLQVADRDGRRIDAEQLGGERLDVAFGYPRGTEIGVDVAGQHVFGLD